MDILRGKTSDESRSPWFPVDFQLEKKYPSRVKKTRIQFICRGASESPPPCDELLELFPAWGMASSFLAHRTSPRMDQIWSNGPIFGQFSDKLPWRNDSLWTTFEAFRTGLQWTSSFVQARIPTAQNGLCLNRLCKASPKPGLSSVSILAAGHKNYSI